MSLRTLLFIIFTLSGFSGIIYESIWTHYLKLFLGHAAYAQVLVLAIFMGGMALGAWLCSRYSSRWRNLFLWYAAAELVIGLMGLLFHDLFDAYINYAYSVLIPGMESVAAIQLFKWGTAALMILPQSVLLGMTFPIMSAAVIRHDPSRPGSTIAMLYFTNSIGAAVGVLVSGFLLISWFGLPGTLTTAAVINITLALLVWQLARRHATPPLQLEQGSGAVSGVGHGFRLFMAVSLLTGVASFIYEIAWIRMLSLVLGSSTHAFEMMLSAFILGLALGGLWIRRRIDLLPNPERFLGLVQIAMGVLALSTLPLYGNSFAAMSWILEVAEKSELGYLQFNLASHAIALVIMVPTTFCAGMTLPLITHLLLRRGHGERAIGSVYTANTLGAIIGIVLAINVGMPLLGLKQLIVAGAVVDITLGLYLLWRVCGFEVRRVALVTSATAIVALLLVEFGVTLDPFKMASGGYRDLGMLDPATSKLLYHRDGKTATASVNEHKGAYFIRSNGKADASIGMSEGHPGMADESTMVMLGALPLLLKPDAERIANIGFGSGQTTHTLLASPRLKVVDTIEIEPAMVEAAELFRPKNERAYSDPRSQIHIDDAKTFFSASKQRYDIIVSEPSNPWVSGVSSLFTREFYHQLSPHLTDDGLLVQWIHLYEIDFRLVASVIRALSSEFPHYEIYAPNYADIVIVASKRARVPQLSTQALAYPELARALSRIGINTLYDVKLRRVGNSRIVGPMVEQSGVATNSDYYPLLDLEAVKSRFMGATAPGLIALASEPLPALEMLGVVEPLQGQSDATPYRYFKISRSVASAVALRQLYLGKRGEGARVKVNSLYMNEAKELVRLLRGCTMADTPRHDEARNLNNIFNASIRFVPYLSAEELEQIWQRLESKPCIEQLSHAEWGWYQLFKALGRRDADAIAELFEPLLKADQKITQMRFKYLLVAAVLANVTLERGGTVDAIWQRYGERAYGTKEPGFLLRLLLELGRRSE